MTRNKTLLIGIVLISLMYSACGIPQAGGRKENKAVPEEYVTDNKDSVNTASGKWKDFFKDSYLAALIDTALNNNQELNIMAQEIIVAQTEIRARKGEYLPFVNYAGGAAVDKVARYTNIGASEATTDIEPGRATPDPLQNYMGGFVATWELDIWHKLHNAKDAAIARYLATAEGRNFMITNIVAEISMTYYELLALDNQLAIVKSNIQIQSDALEIVKREKIAARVTELAVRRFEALVLHTKSLQFDIQQKIVEAENKINFLCGRFPQPVLRSTQDFGTLTPDSVFAGIPSQLLDNRPDIRQAELELAAAKLDVKVARANFYPRLGLSAGLGLQAFNPAYLVKAPESILYSLAADLVGPLVNKNAIKATFISSNAKQMQAVFNYERTILNAYIEVANQVSNINNLRQSYDLKSQQVAALTRSVDISNNLFKSARADYMEVLLTQRDALESRFELIETKMQQMHAMVNIYRALGGGWK